MRILAERHVVEDALDRAGIDPESLRTGYSGRGMYGATCLGITGNISDMLNFLAEMIRILEIENAPDGDPYNADPHPVVTLLIENVCEDGMGYESIYYWPGLGVKDE